MIFKLCRNCRALNEQTLQHILTSDLNSPLSIHVYQNANLTPRLNWQNCTESIVSYSHRRLKHLKPIPNIEIWSGSLEVMLEFWYIEHGLPLGSSGYHWHAPSKGFFSVCWNLSFLGRQSTVSMVFLRALTERVPLSLNEGRRLTRIILNDDFELRACIEKAYVVATYSV